MIRQTVHLCVRSHDLKKSEEFYSRAFGLSIAFEIFRGGKRSGFYLDCGNNTFLEIFEVTEPSVPSGKLSTMAHIALECDDIHAVCEKIKLAGYGVSEPCLGCDHTFQAWVTDPAGLQIELQQYTSESNQITRKNIMI